MAVLAHAQVLHHPHRPPGRGVEQRARDGEALAVSAQLRLPGLVLPPPLPRHVVRAADFLGQRLAPHPVTVGPRLPVLRGARLVGEAAGMQNVEVGTAPTGGYQPMAQSPPEGGRLDANSAAAAFPAAQTTPGQQQATDSTWPSPAANSAPNGAAASEKDEKPEVKPKWKIYQEEMQQQQIEKRLKELARRRFERKARENAQKMKDYAIQREKEIRENGGVDPWAFLSEPWPVKKQEERKVEEPLPSWPASPPSGGTAASDAGAKVEPPNEGVPKPLDSWRVPSPPLEPSAGIRASGDVRTLEPWPTPSHPPVPNAGSRPVGDPLPYMNLSPGSNWNDAPSGSVGFAGQQAHSSSSSIGLPTSGGTVYPDISTAPGARGDGTSDYVFSRRSAEAAREQQEREKRAREEAARANSNGSAAAATAAVALPSRSYPSAASSAGADRVSHLGQDRQEGTLAAGGLETMSQGRIDFDWNPPRMFAAAESERHDREKRASEGLRRTVDANAAAMFAQPFSASSPPPVASPDPFTGQFAQPFPASSPPPVASPVPFTGQFAQPFSASSLPPGASPVPFTGQFAQPFSASSPPPVASPVPFTGQFAQPLSASSPPPVASPVPFTGQFAQPLSASSPPPVASPVPFTGQPPTPDRSELEAYWDRTLPPPFYPPSDDSSRLQTTGDGFPDVVPRRRLTQAEREQEEREKRAKELARRKLERKRRELAQQQKEWDDERERERLENPQVASYNGGFSTSTYPAPASSYPVPPGSPANGVLGADTANQNVTSHGVYYDAPHSDGRPGYSPAGSAGDDLVSRSVGYLQKQNVQHNGGYQPQQNVQHNGGYQPLSALSFGVNQPEMLEEKMTIWDDINMLLKVLPRDLKEKLLSHPRQGELLEVVLDLGRRPEARFLGGGGEYWREEKITREDLEFAMLAVGDFGGDNRAGIEGTLHRISAIRSRKNQIVGLTCRVGRAVTGQVNMVQDILHSGQSILFLGRPGVGKTTVIREMARVLADKLHKRVVIVDTSNEIGGDGDVPHPAIGSARRMQVPDPSMQHRVMVEAVENHMPEVVIVDEVGTEEDAMACRTIAERGVMLVATAHGIKLENIIKNPTLCDLVGGVQTVILGDEQARSRGSQKSVLERKAPPTFPLLIEMRERNHWVIHQTDKSVDCLLHAQKPVVEVRTRDENFKVVVNNRYYDNSGGRTDVLLGLSP